MPSAAFLMILPRIMDLLFIHNYEFLATLAIYLPQNVNGWTTMVSLSALEVAKLQK